MAIAADRAGGLLRQALADLAPFPGRAALTWRVALLCALVTLVAMVYELPEASISCYLIIFLMKPDAVVNIGTALGLIVLVTLVVAFVVLLTHVAIESPALRLALIALISFGFLFIGAASQLGEIGGVIALVIAFVLTLLSNAPFGDAVTMALRYAWYMAAMPMALMIVFNLFVGMSPVRLLREKLRQRLQASLRVISDDTAQTRRALADLLGEGNEDVEKQATFVRVLHLVSSDAAGQVARDVRAAYRLMVAVACLPEDLDPTRRAAIATQIEHTLLALDQGLLPPTPMDQATPLNVAEQEIWKALAVLAGELEGTVVSAAKPSFFNPDAFTNPDYQRFALKTTAAAMVCYVIYTGIDWQGIHTAMITCYVAALGTTGETVHKLGLRIVGCLIGAAMGIGAILFVMPHLESVGGLMTLVFVGTLVGGWVSSGNERISYGGVQIALAFLLTVVQGFGPSLDLDAARDRIFGILLGNFVVYVIFTQVWAVSIEKTVRNQLADALSALARLAHMEPARRLGAVPHVAAIENTLAKCGASLELIAFEPRAIRPSQARENALHVAAEEIEALARGIYLDRGDLSPLASRLEELSRVIREPTTDTPVTTARPATGNSSLINVSLDRLETAVVK
ncbi:FUSC family protein [Ancylobacter pratisalsi]|uniref:FUSC family protein n=1 Tax=Ancylobacter pratisalsi TaxID=1745854 RepID=A0A6P1YR98_9HYPH|nr:FUSC family protein [Ancylobacter pratisalsi]QIB35555.1 FUSC family protein [Ancylobacter pratisalsi]